jgi:hypothetical protein
MRNEFTPVIERDGEWFIGWSPEIPGANGKDEAWRNAEKAFPRPSN